MPHTEDFDPQKHITQKRATEIADAYMRRKNLNPTIIPDSYTWISAQVSNPRLRILLNDLHNSFWELQDKEDTRSSGPIPIEKMFRIIRQTFIQTVNKGWHEGLWSQQERDEAINWGAQEAKEFIESVKNIRYPQDQPQDQPHYY